MRWFRGSKGIKTSWFEDEVLWGVARREGFSDTNDPLAHRGLTQHAFEAGIDDRAICGFEPPRRPSRVDIVPRPQLALAGTDNPRCPRCAALIERRPAFDAGETATEQVAGDASPDPWGVTGPKGGEDADQVAPREPGWEPRMPGEFPPEFDDLGDVDQEKRPAARRRSVRRGGIVSVKAGHRSTTVDVPQVPGLSGMVANVEPPMDDLRVVSVTFADQGRATIVLNRVASSPVTVAWYLVLNPTRQDG